MSTPSRPRRADAVRNRDLLLAAAQDEFAERGLEASVADIARRAGVGKGTVFRHFPTKDDLIAAIVRTHVDALDALGRDLLRARDAGPALLEFLTEAAGKQQRDLSFLLRASERNPEVLELRDRLYVTIGDLVERAKLAGAIRADVTGVDVILLMCAPGHVVDYLSDPMPHLWERYLGIVFDGLRPEGAHPLRPDPPSLSGL
ncbi:MULTISPECIES: TetR/AcrR family transcriptional regulator [unclassified Nocardioides]|uniref:TetR/AcrR family transcriptional regulator n=1 Tax=unclassified Nocardioides TaxID=2615069 RepID=UPI000702D56C|nr:MULTISPECIES: TetR/AcrR family transcriptional regulator [unclassified Nocardioides]KRC48895.1 TetR family transcriptional regulator [Nocardioides sp. Root79]KRC75294.1 TetR family transcriptional regulator [Nocardioides sp. Root240]